jgi:hypothetical protein
MRGKVQMAERRPEDMYDFTIVGTNPIAFVRVKYLTRIFASFENIEAEFRHDVLLLRLIAQTTAVSCELWLRSKHGTWRFFRVTGNGITELGHNGMAVTG